MSFIINLISETHHSCERKKYIFIILRKYTIIFLLISNFMLFYFTYTGHMGDQGKVNNNGGGRGISLELNYFI